MRLLVLIALLLPLEMRAESSTPLNCQEIFQPTRLAFHQNTENESFLRWAWQNVSETIGKALEGISNNKLTREPLFEAAKIAAAENGQRISEYIQNYKELTREQLFEVAKIAAVQDDRGTSEYIQNYKELTRKQLFEVAKIAAAQNCWETSLHIQNYKELTREQLFEVAKIVAAQNGWVVSKHIQNYNKLTREQLFEVAKIAATQNGWGTSEYIQNYKGLTKYQYREIFKICIRGNSDAHVVSNFQKNLPHLFGNPRWADFIAPFNRNRMGFVSPSLLEKLSESHEIKDVQAVFIQYGISENLINIAWDKIQKRETGIQIIKAALRLQARRQPIPQTSIEIVSKATGLNLSPQSPKISDDTLGVLYELALDIQDKLYGPVFRGVNITTSLHQDGQRLIDLLTLIRDIMGLYATKREGALAVLQTIGQREVSASTYASILGDLHSLFNRQLQSLFSSSELNIAYKDLQKLQNDWGNLEPIYTLISRYNGKSNWKKLLPVLAVIFKASLAGNFQELKFKGLNEDDREPVKRQLSPLATDEERNEWLRPRVLVQRAEQNRGGLSESDIRSQIHADFDNNLMVHMGKDKYDRRRFQSLAGLVDFIAEQKLAPQDIYKRILERYHLGPQQVETNKSIVSNILSQFKSLPLTSIPKVLSFLSYLFRQDAELVDLDQKEQVEIDLKAMRDKANSQLKVMASEEGLVLTVLNSDPRFLLTIGDLVKTSSCQNYRTGAYIETLLGYVLDANVQALASFTVGRAHFRTQEEFARVLRTYQSGETLDVEFNGNLRIVTWRLSNGETVESLPLGSAYLRQMVKLGKNSDGAGIYLEREYLQNHAYIEQMREQHQRVFDELLRATGATRRRPLTVYGSRSSGGQYSDAGGGVQTRDYQIP